MRHFYLSVVYVSKVCNANVLSTYLLKPDLSKNIVYQLLYNQTSELLCFQHNVLKTKQLRSLVVKLVIVNMFVDG